MAHLLLLGYASFAHLINRKGFKIQNHADNHITFWHNNEKPEKGEYEPYQIKYRSFSDCGCLVINPIVMNDRFKECADDIKYYCQRPTNPLDRSSKPSHCSPRKRDICTKIYSGECVECLNAAEAS